MLTVVVVQAAVKAPVLVVAKAPVLVKVVAPSRRAGRQHLNLLGLRQASVARQLPGLIATQVAARREPSRLAVCSLVGLLAEQREEAFTELREFNSESPGLV